MVIVFDKVWIENEKWYYFIDENTNKISWMKEVDFLKKYEKVKEDK